MGGAFGGAAGFLPSVGFLFSATIGGFAGPSGFLVAGGASRHFCTQTSDAFLHSSTHATTWSQAKSQSVSVLWHWLSQRCTLSRDAESEPAAWPNNDGASSNVKPQSGSQHNALDISRGDQRPRAAVSEGGA